jgi:RNA polymerase sigma-70 factor (ECF subfamily)
VLNMMVARLRCRADAEDAAREAFLRAFASLPSLREPAAFRGWLRTTAERVASDLGRRRPGQAAGEPGDPAAPAAPPPLETEERRAAVARAIEGLEEPFREVVLLRYDRGLSCAQIAQALRVSPAAVSMRLHRAHQALAGSLSEWGERA